MPLNRNQLNDLVIFGADIAVERYKVALLQLNIDLSLLKKNNHRIKPLLEHFNKAFLNNADLINTVDAKNFADDKITNTKQEISRVMKESKLVENATETPFTTSLAKANISQDLAANIHLSALYDLVSYTAHECGKLCHLAYHNIYHTAGEMLNDPGALASVAGLNHWHLFLMVSGLFHDAIFLRSRVDDENASAQLMMMSFTPYLQTLGEQDKQLIQALIRVVIVGGTLPVFTATHAKDYDHMSMVPLWQFYLEKFSEQGHNCVELREVLIACQAMSDADSQRTLIPELIMQFPEQKQEVSALQQKLAERIAPYATKLVAITRNVTEFSETDLAIVIEQSKLMILTKLGQGIRFLIESKGTGDAVYKPLNATQMKLATVLRGGECQLVEADFDCIAKLLEDSEVKFANYVSRALTSESIIVGFTRPYSFHIESWSIHKDVLFEFISYLKNPAVMLQDKMALVQQLLVNASHQQGARIDMQSLMNNAIRDVTSALGSLRDSYTFRPSIATTDERGSDADSNSTPVSRVKQVKSPSSSFASIGSSLRKMLKSATTQSFQMPTIKEADDQPVGGCCGLFSKKKTNSVSPLPLMQASYVMPVIKK